MYVQLLSFTPPVLLPCPTQLHVVSQSLPVLPFQIEDAMRPDTDTVSAGDMVGWWYTAVQHLQLSPQWSTLVVHFLHTQFFVLFMHVMQSMCQTLPVKAVSNIEQSE